MWNRYRTVPAFDGQPWLLRFFDQLRFYPVSADELARIRRDFPLGRFPLRIEPAELHLAQYQDFLRREVRTSRPSNHTRPRPSTRSASAGSTPDRRTSKATTRRQAPQAAPLPEGCHGVESDITGNRGRCGYRSVSKYRLARNSSSWNR